MNKADVLNYRKLAWQLRQQYQEARFFALLANDSAAQAQAESDLALLDVREDALNRVETAILMREQLEAPPEPEPEPPVTP